MNAAIEFHDSEVSTVEITGDRIRIHFSAAYVHQSAGQPGIDAGSGYTQAVDVCMSEAALVGSQRESIGSVSDGDLVANGQSMKNVVPLPFEAIGTIKLNLQFCNGTLISVEAKSVTIRQVGQARFVEAYKC